MAYSIICPYCFNEKNGGNPIEDDQVLFRSEKINIGECDALPDDYDDVESFIHRYNGSDKEEILQKYKDWDFFSQKKDEVYEEFWSKFGGTTETNPLDQKNNKVEAYYRKVIDPNNSEHQKYLVQQADGSYFIRDNEGMVAQIELTSGEKCHRRVCPFCHNPFPDAYGKFPVKFATIIGITGAGKTVYLSQLLKRMRSYAVKVGLDAHVTNAGVRVFLDNNSIDVQKPLPGSTPPNRLQQPLFYEMVKEGDRDERYTDTFVLYDVAGEVFRDESGDQVRRFAPFVEHADGVIVLIDPMQFEVISGTSRTHKQLDDPTTALNTIHHIISNGNTKKKCDIPFAICISKSDTEEVQEVFGEDLCSLLVNDVEGIKGDDGYPLPIFNAKEYAPICEKLNRFIMDNELTLAKAMKTNYSTYKYFAFTALGCDVEEKEDGNTCPIGPVIPKRVEEPLLWLFYRLGYIGRNADLPGEVPCPKCGSIKTFELPEDERVDYVPRGPFGIFRKKVDVDRYCEECNHKWLSNQEQ